MENNLDHYEQQLFKVFNNHDNENKGSLDRDGLTKLCQTLQLEEQSNQLVKVLLKEQKTRVTFVEFKEALLSILGNLQKNGESVDASPDREVSPKFVYGSKKYGRRSRCEEVSSLAKEEKDNNYINKSNTVQRSNSQNEVTYSKKRKTITRLKRCTSLPGHNGYNENFLKLNGDYVCTEDMLREAWKKLGVGEDGFLNQTELILVCDAIGLNKLADNVIRQLSNKLVLDYNKKISFQDLLEVIQQDETWNEFFNPTIDKDLDNNFSDSLPNSKVLQHIKLGSDGSGYINSDVIIDLWENAGIVSPKSLLNDLGFRERQINVQELSAVLEKEIKGLTELRTDHICNPHIALLHAFLTLYQTEIKYLRNLLEQMQVEREKLKCDVFEANNRSSLLAQEVDDNVAKMEMNTQKHVKLLEQRHADILKEVTEQFLMDKKQMNLLNHSLEVKIKSLESEELKLRDDILNAQKYSQSIDKENQELLEKISEYDSKLSRLQDQIHMLEEEKVKINELELEKRDKLLLKLSELQAENTSLRDKHDEMVSKIEALSSENAACKYSEYSAVNLQNDMETVESVGLGSKRRNDNCPTDDLNSLDISSEESPRLGKVRKFHRAKIGATKTMSENSSSNEPTYLECHEIAGNCNRVFQLERKIECLEQLLNEHSIPIPTSPNNTDIQEILNVATMKTMERVVQEIKRKVDRIGESPEDLKSLKTFLSTIFRQTDFQQIETFNHSDLMKKLERENKELVEKCEDLESGMGLLRNEYEKCEDYWQSKLEEERRLFEQEQEDNNRQFNELLVKLADFEEQFSKDSNRLPTIDETVYLEKQFTDLEKEFEDYKTFSQNALDDKDVKIKYLQDKLPVKPETADVTVQVSEEDKTLNLSFHLESSNLFSADALPFNWNQMEQPIDEDSSEDRPWSREEKYSSSNPPFSDKTDSYSPYPLPTTSNILNNNSTPFRQKKVRRHDRLSAQQRVPKKHVIEEKRENLPSKWEGVSDLHEENEEPKCLVSVSALNRLQAKKHHLEQRCKRLQLVLKQQHCYDEQYLQYMWQHYMSEKAELQYYLKYYQEKFEQQIRLTSDLQERLARNDLLAKDLFVDNTYLKALNLRLEKQCDMLVNSNCKSV